MQILIIPSWYSSKGLPSSGIFFRDQAVALSKLGGHYVVIIDISFHGRKDLFNSNNFRFKYYNDEGVHVYSLKIPSFYILSRIHVIHNFIYRILLFYVYNRIIKKGIKFDIIHAHSYYPAGYHACYLASLEKIPLIITEHSSGIMQNHLKKREKKLLEYSLLHSKRFICVSEGLKLAINNMINLNNNLIVIPNMYSGIFHYSNVKKDKEIFQFISVGSLIDRKRHAFTISCFNKAFKGMPNAKLIIIGDGELYGDLKKQIIANDLTGKVELIGQMSREEIKAMFHYCSVFVLNSSYETFGVVYIEALACGLPVIATKNGGADCIVNETNGILIDVDNEDQLINALKYIYHNIDKYDNKSIAVECKAKYSEESVVRQLSTVYSEVLSGLFIES